MVTILLLNLQLEDLVISLFKPPLNSLNGLKKESRLYHKAYLIYDCLKKLSKLRCKN